MASAVITLVVCAALTCGVVLSQPGGGRQPFFPPNTGGNFNCPQERGQFEYPGDCTKYYQCDGGVPTLSNCPPQLIFNPRDGYCDWPHRAQNPDCAAQASPLIPQLAQICRNNPGNPQEAFNVAHPDMCNAFYTCSTSYLFAPCTFCGEGMYFNQAAGACRDYMATQQDVNALCQGRQFVQHADKVMRQLDGSCWPYSFAPNPYQVLVDSLRGGQPPRGG